MCALVLALASLSARAAALPGEPTLRTTLRWHDNATNADLPADILPAFETVTEATVSPRRLLGRDDSLLLGARLLAELWPRYDGLDRIGLGLAWQHKFALGPYAPTLRAEFTGDTLAARERPRDALLGTATLAYRQRLSTGTTLRLAHEWARTDARALAFDRTGRETTAQLSHQLTPARALTLTARLREGTVQAYSTPPRPDLIAKGKILTLVTTFDRDRPFVAYYCEARTRSGELRASRALGPRLALTLAAERRTPRDHPRPLSLF